MGLALVHFQKYWLLITLTFFSLQANTVTTPELVSLWTNNRVMEWLRTANLSEYSPNLRGSGVHGALMVHEPLFTSDLLAALLSIPSHKTLLRRHLNLHFNDLVGKSVMQIKREAESQPNHSVSFD